MARWMAVPKVYAVLPCAFCAKRWPYKGDCFVNSDVDAACTFLMLLRQDLANRPRPCNLREDAKNASSLLSLWWAHGGATTREK